MAAAQETPATDDPGELDTPGRRAMRARNRLLKRVGRRSLYRWIDLPAATEPHNLRNDGRVVRATVVEFRPSGKQVMYFPTVRSQIEAVAHGVVAFHESDWGEPPAIYLGWSAEELQAWLDAHPKHARPTNGNTTPTSPFRAVGS